MERDQATKFINDLLKLMISRRGSDLFITADFPPAIKVDGKRAYARVRAGEAVELAPRTVIITDLEVLAIRRQSEDVDVDIRVQCSAGTYVRAIARDMGEVLGVGGAA